MPSTEDNDQRMQWHASGVHYGCKPGKNSGSWRSCRHAGKVERFHDHDYDGPLVCGCDELGE